MTAYRALQAGKPFHQWFDLTTPLVQRPLYSLLIAQDNAIIDAGFRTVPGYRHTTNGPCVTRKSHTYGRRLDDGRRPGTCHVWHRGVGR